MSARSASRLLEARQHLEDKVMEEVTKGLASTDEANVGNHKEGHVTGACQRG